MAGDSSLNCRSARARSCRLRYPLRLSIRSAPRRLGASPCLDRDRPAVPARSAAWKRRVSGAVRGRRRPRGSRCRRIGSAGTGVRAGVGVAYLRALEAGGIALDAARGMIYSRLAADADQFLTMAKFRALRKLWARVEAACGLDAEAGLHRRRNRLADADAARPLREHAARDDGDVRGRPRRRQRHHGAAAYAGAADCPMRSRAASRATPNWCCSKNPISRKSPIPPQAPAASKRLTQQLCHAAWTLFQEIEKAGGIWPRSAEPDPAQGRRHLLRCGGSPG